MKIEELQKQLNTAHYFIAFTILIIGLLIGINFSIFYQNPTDQKSIIVVTNSSDNNPLNNIPKNNIAISCDEGFTGNDCSFKKNCKFQFHFIIWLIKKMEQK